MLMINDLSYAYTGAGSLFSGLSMSVGQGEFVSLVGASGCGKSTLFKIIAGLLAPASGELIIGGQVSLQPELRLGKIAYMPQQDLLLPWRTVMDNCLLPWELKKNGKPAKEEQIQQIRGMLARFGLAGVEHQYPQELSGGMRQRAALLRTIAADTELLLLDEPFGALDAITKREMQRWLLELWDGLGKSVLFITHDLEEALLLSDRIYLMSGSPGIGLQELPVALPRPRDYQMNYEPQFVAMRADLEQRLYDSKIVQR